MVSGFLSCFELKLALAELRRATGSLEAVFLTLFHSRITCQESCFLKHRSVIIVCFQKCSCDTVTDCSCLSCVTAAFYVYDYIEFTFGLCCNQRLTNNNL